MNVGIDKIEMQTHDPRKVLRFFDIRRSGYGFLCRAAVRSGDFACERPFFIDDFSLDAAIRGLSSMNERLEGKVRLDAQFDPDYVEIECDAMGHVVVSGEFHYHAERPQLLQFAFDTDQTVLQHLVNSLKQLAAP